MKNVLLLTITLTFLFIFLYWSLSVLLPVTLVEMNYQRQRILRDVFHTTSIRRLLLPQFNFDLKGFTSKYTTDGITIPAIFLDEPVIYNIDPNEPSKYLPALKKGIAHASSTAFPGVSGVGYYFAHSSTPEYKNQYNAVFYLLGKLKPGDEIYLFHEGVRFDYQVTHQKITEANDIPT